MVYVLFLFSFSSWRETSQKSRAESMNPRGFTAFYWLFHPEDPEGSHAAIVARLGHRQQAPVGAQDRDPARRRSTQRLPGPPLAPLEGQPDRGVDRAARQMAERVRGGDQRKRLARARQGRERALE